MVPEYFDNILGKNNHIEVTCIHENFESNRALVLCVLCLKSGRDMFTSVLPEVIN